MGLFASRENRRHARDEDIDDQCSYRFPPKSGRYFGPHFMLGGEMFDTVQPEAFLFGDNCDLNFIGANPVSLPYSVPSNTALCTTLRALVNIRRDSVRLVRCRDGVGGARSGPSRPPTPAVIQCSAPPDTDATYNIEFTFDADVSCTVCVQYVCTEWLTKHGPVYQPRDPILSSPVYRYPAGSGQRFHHPEHVLCPARLVSACGGTASCVNSCDWQLLPLVIECRADEVVAGGSGGQLTDSSLSSSSASVVTAPASSSTVAPVAPSAPNVPVAPAVVPSTCHLPLRRNRQCHVTLAFIEPTASSSAPTSVPAAECSAAAGTEVATGAESQADLIPGRVDNDDELAVSTLETAGTSAPSTTTANIATTAINYHLKPIKQKLFVDGLVYLLQEVYGIENKRGQTSTSQQPPSPTTTPVAATTNPLPLHSDSEGEEEQRGQYDEWDDEESGCECVICMSATRNTLILPCRHLCVCAVCARHLRYQASCCPICRAPFRALLQLHAVRPMVTPAADTEVARQRGDRQPNTDSASGDDRVDGGEEEEEESVLPTGYQSVSLVEALNGPSHRCLDSSQSPPPAAADCVPRCSGSAAGPGARGARVRGSPCSPSLFGACASSGDSAVVAPSSGGGVTLDGSTIGLVDSGSLAARNEDHWKPPPSPLPPDVPGLQPSTTRSVVRSRTPSREKAAQPPLLLASSMATDTSSVSTCGLDEFANVSGLVTVVPVSHGSGCNSGRQGPLLSIGVSPTSVRSANVERTVRADEPASNLSRANSSASCGNCPLDGGVVSRVRETSM